MSPRKIVLPGDPNLNEHIPCIPRKNLTIVLQNAEEILKIGQEIGKFLRISFTKMIKIQYSGMRRLLLYF